MTSNVDFAKTLTFTWDALGRQLTEVNRWGTVSSAWDAAGRRTRLQHPDGFQVDYDYLVTGETLKIRENGATSGVGVLATYAYDDLGRRTSLTRGNGTVKSYTYDAVSRLASLGEDLTGTSADLSQSFTWNPASQAASVTRSNDSYAWTDHYNLNRNYSSNGLNQYTASGSVTPTYDSKGNLTSAGATTYGYNSDNLLTHKNGVDIANYDGLLRLSRLGSSSQPTTRFNYDGLDLIGEYDGSSAMLRRYVHGPGADEPIVWYEGSGTTDRRFLHSDERGSVIAASNSSGTTLSTNAYDEYGIPKSTNTGRFQYTGQTWLPELGMYYYKARLYSPTLGRFLQTDPIGYGDGMNLYAYVGSDPVNFRDPTGLCSLSGWARVRHNEDWTEVEVLDVWIEITGCDSVGGSGVGAGAGALDADGSPLQGMLFQAGLFDDAKKKIFKLSPEYRKILQRISATIERIAPGKFSAQTKASIARQVFENISVRDAEALGNINLNARPLSLTRDQVRIIGEQVNQLTPVELRGGIINSFRAGVRAGSIRVGG